MKISSDLPISFTYTVGSEFGLMKEKWPPHDFLLLFNKYKLCVCSKFTSICKIIFIFFSEIHVRKIKYGIELLLWKFIY